MTTQRTLNVIAIREFLMRRSWLRPHGGICTADMFVDEKQWEAIKEGRISRALQRDLSLMIHGYMRAR